MAKIKWEKGGVYYEAWSKTKSILIESMEKKLQKTMAMSITAAEQRLIEVKK